AALHPLDQVRALPSDADGIPAARDGFRPLHLAAADQRGAERSRRLAAREAGAEVSGAVRGGSAYRAQIATADTRLRICSVYDIFNIYTFATRPLKMRTNIEIDDALMAAAQKASGRATKKQTVEDALRLMIRMQQQREVGRAFGKYRWRGNLSQGRRGRGTD